MNLLKQKFNIQQNSFINVLYLPSIKREKYTKLFIVFTTEFLVLLLYFIKLCSLGEKKKKKLLPPPNYGLEIELINVLMPITLNSYPKKICIGCCD